MTARRSKTAAALAWLTALLCASADAAVYRCGNAYADVPCPQATLIDAADPRSDADRAAAGDVARREAALAARMAADRESAERLLLRPAARPVHVKPSPRQGAPATPSAASKRRSQHRLGVDTDGNFVVVLPRKR